MISDCLLNNDSVNLPVNLFQKNVKPKIDEKVVISDCLEHQKMPGYAQKIGPKIGLLTDRSGKGHNLHSERTKNLLEVTRVERDSEKKIVK